MLQWNPSRSSKKYANSKRHVLPHISVSKRSFEIRLSIRLMKSCCLPRPKNPMSLSVLSAKWWLKNSPNFEFRKRSSEKYKSCFKRRLKRRLTEPRAFTEYRYLRNMLEIQQNKLNGSKYMADFTMTE